MSFQRTKYIVNLLLLFFLQRFQFFKDNMKKRSEKDCMIGMDIEISDN